MFGCHFLSFCVAVGYFQLKKGPSVGTTFWGPNVLFGCLTDSCVLGAFPGGRSSLNSRCSGPLGRVPSSKGRPMGPATPLVLYNQVLGVLFQVIFFAFGKFVCLLYWYFFVGKRDDSLNSVALKALARKGDCSLVFFPLPHPSSSGPRGVHCVMTMTLLGRHLETSRWWG